MPIATHFPLRCDNRNISRHCQMSWVVGVAVVGGSPELLHTGRRAVFSLLMGTGSKQLPPRSNKWSSQADLLGRGPCQSLSQNLRRLRGRWHEGHRSPLSSGSLLSLEQKEGDSPLNLELICVSSESVLWKRYTGSVKIFREITYLERVSLFQHHKTEILEIDVTTFVMNWHGQLILQIHHGKTLPAPKV